MTDELLKHDIAYLIAVGYRRTSNKHCIVSRIDRPDFVQVMAKEMRRAPADFYMPGSQDVHSFWEDQYRSVYSKDKLALGPTGSDAARKVPSSTGERSLGYIAKWDTGERIVAAAIAAFGVIFSVPAPGRHADIFEQYSKRSSGSLVGCDKQGFLTSSGRFVDRSEAVGIAQRAGQITEPRWPPELYSEDLW